MNMIALSVTTGYAIQALRCLESGDCVPRQIHDIAHCTGVPRAYLAKVMNALAQQGLVHTRRGYRGGIVLARGANEISLRQIIEAVEGKEWIARCLLGLDNCGRPVACPVHEFWGRIRQEIVAEFDAVTLEELMRGSCAGERATCANPTAKTRTSGTPCTRKTRSDRIPISTQSFNKP